MCVVLAAGLAGAVPAHAVDTTVAPPPAADTLWTPAEHDSLQHVQDLVTRRAYVAADSSARRLLAGVAGRAGEDALPVARVLDPLVLALVGEGREANPETRALAERTVRIEESALGPDDLELAASRNLLGKVLVRSGEPAAALPVLELALRARERQSGPSGPDVAESHNNLAFALTELGDYAAARGHYQAALTIWSRRSGARSLDVATALDNLAGLLERTGDFATARDFYDQALSIREAANPGSVDVARTLSNLGNLLTDTGDFDAARSRLVRARAIREAVLPVGHPDIAASLANLANLAMARGERDSARTLFEQALDLQQKALGPDHLEVARSLSRLAELHRADGDLGGALALGQRALDIRRRKLGPDHPDVAASLNDVAVAHVMAGDVASARTEYESAMKILTRTLGPSHPDLAKNLERFAELLLAQGQEREAAGFAMRAETVGRENFRSTMGNLTEREALAFARVRSSGLDIGLSVLDSLPDPASRRSVLDAVVHARALVLDEMAVRHRSLHTPGDPGVDTLTTVLSATATRYMNLLERGPDAAHPERYLPLLEQARRQKEAAERSLSQRSSVFRHEQRAKEIGLADVAAALPARSALAAYVAYREVDPKSPSAGEPAYLAYLVRGGPDEPAVVPLGLAARVDTLVARWRDEAALGVLRPLARQKAAYESAGRALRQAIWDPLVSHLNGINRVFIVPDGAINLVSFATLPLDDGAYLVERGPLLHYLSAERDLVPLDSLRAPGSGLLLVGGPAFDVRAGAAPARPAGPAATYRGARSTCGDFAAVRFGPLPGTLSEVKEVGQLWRDEEAHTVGAAGAGGASGPVVELTGTRASEEAFKQDAPGTAVLHIATHGFFFTGQCPSATDADTRGIGYLVHDGKSPPRAPHRPPSPPRLATDTAESPLVLSGLALAGANERARAAAGDEDGILTAEEIAALDLARCDWAVLSACDTGVGEIRAGEGVFGLRRAFAVAGARTLIMSLWSVDDQSTRAWMRPLYGAHFHDGLATADAVRAASLAVLRARRAKGQSTHPFYWGGFVAAGDWR